jgi:hypothetical protein
MAAINSVKFLRDILKYLVDARGFDRVMDKVCYFPLFIIATPLSFIKRNNELIKIIHTKCPLRKVRAYNAIYSNFVCYFFVE